VKKVFGLLGEHLAHSYSPFIHGFLGGYEYPLYEVPPGGLAEFMTRKDFDGINVTIPYKQAVIPYCARLSAEARSAGSVNTIVRETDGSLSGHNTDGYGFNEMLSRGGIDPAGKAALVLGDGGAARTVRAVLGRLGAKEILTVSRRGGVNYENVYAHHDAQIIINATPVGMFPDNGRSPLSLTEFKRLKGVADLIYNPARTALLLEAERAGITCVNGLTMLVCQAEAAARLFTGVPSTPGLAEKIIRELASKMRNIILIGMPGCGKTTAGRALAERMRRPFADTDEVIEKTEGRTIPEIFRIEGEEYFRRAETRALADETKKSGVVIATGGGVVTRPENLDLLRQNGIIIYLKRDAAELPEDGRPLSASIGARALAEQRLPLYEAWSDAETEVEADPKRTAARIMEALNENSRD